MGGLDLRMAQRRRIRRMGRIDSNTAKERRDRRVIVSPENNNPENNNQVTTEVETRDIFKNYDLYLAARNGDLNDFRSVLLRISRSERISSRVILSRVSPIGNTCFHVAAVNGNEDVVKYIAEEVNYIAGEVPSVVLQKNFNGDTALHLAAKVGDESMVKALVLIHHNLLRLRIVQCQVGTEDEADENNLLRAKNERGNTALHESIINGRELIAQYLIKEDPELLYYRNKQGKYVLNLAAKAGFAKCVSSILKCSIDQERLNDQFKQSSPVKAAIMNKNRELLDVILNSSPRFIKLQDGQGRTPLHYAASSGYVEVVHHLVGKHASGVIQRDKSGSFPIHLAAIEGHVDTVSLLLKSCLADPVELLDNSGRNILHLAAENGKFNVVSYILHHPELDKLINMSDKSGNTPLHLATMNWHPEIVSALTWDKRVDIKLSNNKGMTALDAADIFWRDNPPFRQRLTWTALKAAGTPRGKGRFGIGPSVSVEYKERVNTLLLVSTLVATVTFAAGFTLPGGYNTSDADLGMAALLTRKAFQIFVFCDTIAMYSSIVVDVTLIWAQLGDLNLVLDAITLVQPLLVVALTMMSMAFTAGIFLVVRNLHWLSTVVLAMGLAFLVVLLVLLVPLCMPLTSSNRILRYISYYPFWLLMWATRTKSRYKKDG